MIPVTLSIKGLYSYQKQEVIDFQFLTSAGLFGIFGAVGSGKSTILEAITFALYGETERLNKTDGRGYNMMNLKSNELAIDLVFDTGRPIQRYKFTVKCKRNSKQFEKQSSFERNCYVLRDGEWQPIDKTAEQILGLSYENFKRTIIIPQGKFQEFLQLSDTDRVRMLKEIFNLQKYELGDKTSRLVRENESRINHMQGQMQGLPEFDEEALEQKQKEIDAYATSVKALEGQIKAKESAEQSFVEIKTLAEDVSAKQVNLGKLTNSRSEFELLEGRIVTFETYLRLFREPLNKRIEARKAFNQDSHALANLEKEQLELNDLVAECIKTKGELEPAYLNREQLNKKASEYETILLLQQLVNQQQKLQGEIEAEQEHIKQDEARELQSKLQQEALSSTIQQLASTAMKQSELLELRHLSTNHAHIKASLSKLQADIATLNKKQQPLLQTINNNSEELSRVLEVEEVNAEVLDEKGRAFILHCKARVEQLQHQLAELKAHKKLEEFASQLNDHDACPLCGALEHPRLYSATDAEELIKVTEKQVELTQADMQLVEQKLKAIENARLAVGPLEQQMQQWNQESEQQQERLNALNQQLSKLQLTEERLPEVISKAIEQGERLEACRDEAAKGLQHLDALRKSIQVQKDKCAQLQTMISAHEVEYNTRNESITQLNLSLEITKPVATIKKETEKLKKEFEDITCRYEANEEKLISGQRLQDTLKGKLETQALLVDERRAALSAVEDELASLFRQHDVDEDTVVQTLRSKLDVEAERHRLSQYRQELHAATVQLKEAIEKLGGRTYDAAGHKHLSAELGLLKDQREQINKQLIQEQQNLANLKAAMEQRRQLQAQLDQLLLRAENLRVLSQLFRSSGFVNYVSSVYLQNLVSAANERFYKMTRQQLSLELTDKNCFQVRDYMNNGQVRSIKTLSGGQTFQAALSLALALADQIQHLTKSNENFFFLDEGFGSLDKDSLAIVFQTLKNLKKENRIVGVISHVDEMQQEIQVNLKIQNHPENGSSILKSWG